MHAMATRSGPAIAGAYQSGLSARANYGHNTGDNM